MHNRYITVLLTILAISCQNQQNHPAMQSTDQPIRIVFFGNSLTAAYGLEPERGFVALLEERLTESGYNVDVLNAGISGETTGGGLHRIDYVLEKEVDVLVLELGINDAFYGEPAADIKRNLQAMIDRARERHPDVRILLLGIRPPEDIPFNEPQAVFELYRELARDNQLYLTEDLIAQVRNRPRRYLLDDVHPNAEGHRLLAETVWPDLRKLMRER